MSDAPVSAVARLRALFNSRGRFFRDIATVLSGALVSRVIAVLAIPVLARIYSPAEFGLLAMFMTINAILSSIACLRYEMAVVLPEDETEAANLLVASITIATVLSAACFGVFLAIGSQLTEYIGTPELSAYLWLSALSIWLIGIFNAFQSWASRVGQFAGISAATVGGTFATAVVQVLLGFPQRILSGGLIVGQAFGRLVQTLQLGWSCRKSLGATIGNVSIARSKELLIRYRNFPIYDSTASLLNASSRELPVLMLGIFFTPTIIGFYSVGRRMLKVPMQLVDNAISRVFFPKARAEMHKGRLDRLALTVFGKLVAIGVVPMLTLTVTAQAVVAVFLGDKWLESVIYVQWLTVWMLIVFIAAPFAQLFNVLERQRARLVYQLSLMSVRFAALLAGGLLGDPVVAVAAFSAVSAVVTLANCFWLLGEAGVPAARVWQCLLKECVYAAPFVAAVYAASIYLASPLVVLAVAAAIVGVFFMLRHKEVLSRDYAVI